MDARLECVVLKGLETDASFIRRNIQKIHILHFHHQRHKHVTTSSASGLEADQQGIGEGLFSQNDYSQREKFAEDDGGAVSALSEAS